MCERFHVWPPDRLTEAYEEDLEEFRVILSALAEREKQARRG